jgi:hypothetical protein
MSLRIVPIALLASVLACAGGIAAGCGSSSGGAGPQSEPDATDETSPPVLDAGEAGVDVGVEAAGYPAIVPNDIPQVPNPDNGPVLSLPKVYPIYFSTDAPTFTAQITDFLTKVGATNYWNTIGSEYGVGSLVAEAPIQLTAADDPPATYGDRQIRTWLEGKLGAVDGGTADPAFPTPDSNTIFAFFFPPGVTVYTGGPRPPKDGGVEEAGAADAGPPAGSSVSCTDFGGYHSRITIGTSTNVAYAVIPRCSSFDGFTGIDAVTAAASHELVEGTTDPYETAFATTDAPHWFWATVVGGGGEIGDMCAQTLESFTHFPDLPAYLVQRCWSNKAALKGGDPCVPLPTGDVYFNSFPVMPDMISVNDGMTTVMSKGVTIPVGSSKTIEVDLFSNVPTSQEWTLSAYDSNVLAGGTPQLDFSFDKNRGQNGDKIHMTIKVLVAASGNAEPFILYSTLGSSAASPQNIWAGLVGN